MLVGLIQERLLVLLAAQGEQGTLAVIPGKTFFRDRSFAVRKNGNPLLVLMELVALVLEIEDCPEDLRLVGRSGIG